MTDIINSLLQMATRAASENLKKIEATEEQLEFSQKRIKELVSGLSPEEQRFISKVTKYGYWMWLYGNDGGLGKVLKEFGADYLWSTYCSYDYYLNGFYFKLFIDSGGHTAFNCKGDFSGEISEIIDILGTFFRESIYSVSMSRDTMPFYPVNFWDFMALLLVLFKRKQGERMSVAELEKWIWNQRSFNIEL